jgi:hypothetical protein
MSAAGIPLPNRIKLAAEIVLNLDVRNAIEEKDMNLDRIQALLEEARKAGVKLDEQTLEFVLRGRIERASDAFLSAPEKLETLRNLAASVHLAQGMPFGVNFWRVQNGYYDVLRDTYPKVVESASRDDKDARRWLETFRALGGELSVRVE